MDAKTMELKMKQWLPIFEAQAQSGTAKEKWCDENGIKRWDFFKWQRKIRKYQLDQNWTPAEPGFVDITPPLACAHTVMHDESETTADTYRHSAESAFPVNIKYGGFTIELPGDVNERLLSIILKGVRDVD